MFVYDLHDHKLWNTARWQERTQGNINWLMAQYVQVWNHILSQKN